MAVRKRVLVFIFLALVMIYTYAGCGVTLSDPVFYTAYRLLQFNIGNSTIEAKGLITVNSAVYGPVRHYRTYKFLPAQDELKHIIVYDEGVASSGYFGNGIIFFAHNNGSFNIESATELGHFFRKMPGFSITVDNSILIPARKSAGFSIIRVKEGDPPAKRYDILDDFTALPLLADNSNYLFAFSRMDGKMITWLPGSSSRAEHTSLSTGGLDDSFIAAIDSDLFVLNVLDNSGASVFRWNSAADSWSIDGNMSQITVEPSVAVFGNDIAYAHTSGGSLIVDAYSPALGNSTMLLLLPDTIDKMPRGFGVFKGVLYLYSHPRLYFYDPVVGSWDFAEHEPFWNTITSKPIMIINDIGVWIIGIFPP